MNLPIGKLSQQERDFVRTYAEALEREYDAFLSAMQLMHPQGLGLNCPFRAADIATEMQLLHADFDAELAQLATKHQMRDKPAAHKHPPLAEFLQVLQSSFFALAKVDHAVNKTENKGWFSGHPLDWKATYDKSANKLTIQIGPQSSEDFDDKLTDLLKTFMKYFKKAFKKNLFLKEPPAESWDDVSAENDEDEEEDFDTPH